AEILGNPTQRQIFIDTVAGDIIPVPYVYFTVAFDTAGGSYVPSQQVRQGELVVRPEDPTKEGYTFTGWHFISPDWSSPWNFYGHRINWDNTITATWEAIPTFTVTFDTSGGSYVPSQQVRQGELVVRPADPTRDGYTFAGWYFVSPGWTSPWNFYGHRVNWDNTVTAVWEAIPATPTFATNPNMFAGINEADRNSRIWTLSFNTIQTVGNEVTTAQFSIDIEGNNANQRGQHTFHAGHTLEGYTLLFDIRGNGSNIAQLELVR
ncbi:MAG: InlB B-repeat-containing protein, partial [Defluviitaleaceae bacterium]|nr:InlB B-repeat-containing protein [Defluviitaleaceae bacterium]